MKKMKISIFQSKNNSEIAFYGFYDCWLIILLYTINNHILKWSSYCLQLSWSESPWVFILLHIGLKWAKMSPMASYKRKARFKFQLIPSVMKLIFLVVPITIMVLSWAVILKLEKETLPSPSFSMVEKTQPDLILPNIPFWSGWMEVLDHQVS